MSKNTSASQFRAFSRIAFLTIAAFTFSGSVTVAATRHGSFFVLFSTPEFSVIAIDGREVDTSAPGPSYRDDRCGLLPLGPDTIFFPQGIAINADPLVAKFDAFAAARESYSVRDPVRTATAWAEKMVATFQELYPFYPRLLDRNNEGDVVSGYFVGFDTENKLLALAVTIKHHIGDFTYAIRSLSDHYTLGSHPDVKEEFFDGDTPRAIEARDQSQQDDQGEAEEITAARKLQKLVGIVPKWTNDPTIGGETAEIIFELNDRQWRWYSRPSACSHK